MEQPPNTDAPASGLSDSNLGLELIDLEFMRDIELSLMAMIDLASNYYNLIAAKPITYTEKTMLVVNSRSISLAEKQRRKISDWFDSKSE